MSEAAKRLSNRHDSCNRLANLDLLRFVAVAMVLMRHAWWPDKSGPAIDSEHIKNIFWQIRSGGWAGVDLFFVLSGYLVSGLLFKEHIKNGVLGYKRFIIRRSFKIYPPFIVLIAITILVGFAAQQPVAGRAIVSELLFLQNYWLSLWNHTWSLAVEEHFYLILPSILMVIMGARRHNKDTFKPIISIVLVFAVLGLALRIWNANEQFSYKTHLAPTHLRIDSLWCGVLISYLYHYRYQCLCKVARWRWILLLAGIMLMAPPYFRPLEQSRFIYTAGFMLNAWGASLILTSLLFVNLGNGYTVRCLSKIGKHSYSIYLWHMPIHSWGPNVLKSYLGLDPSYGILLLIYLALSIGAGIFMSKLIEYPSLRLRDKYFPSHT